MFEIPSKEPESGYIKFVFSGVSDPEFIIETSFPQDMSHEECIEFMAQMLFYVHSGNLIEQNAASVLETCTDRGHYELGARIIQRWHQYEEQNKPVDDNAPCIPPSSLFPTRFRQ